MLKVLLSGVGRRVELVKIFKENGFNVISLDMDITAPALYFSDKYYKNLKFSDLNFIDNILDITYKEKVDLIFTLIDPELPVLARIKEILKDKMLLFPNYNVISKTYDKSLFFEFFSNLFPENILPTVVVKNFFDNNDCFDNNNWEDFIKKTYYDEFLILKPILGSSSKNVYKIRNIFKYNIDKAKNFLTDFFYILDIKIEDFIIQKYIDYDEEITVDIFYDIDSNVVELCQRKRLKVRAGEVERACTVKYSFLTEFILDLSKSLIQRDFLLVGPVNFQFLIKGSNFYLSEINTRFGGGYPLAYYAGANFMEHIINIYLNKKPNYWIDQRYTTNLFMLRYDSSYVMKFS